MARVKGPLMSLEASGNTTGAAMQFRTVGGRTHVYRPPAPESQNQGPPTPGQEAIRQRFKVAVASWAALIPQARLAWHEKAAPHGVSGFTLFIQDAMNEGGA